MTTPIETKWAAEDAQKRQQGEAEAYLDGFGGTVGYPFAGWAELAQRIQPGEVDFLAAASGQGKTTIVRSIIERLVVEENVGIVWGAFETPPKVARIGMAAMLAGVDPGYVISREWETWEPRLYEDAKQRVRASWGSLNASPWHCLHITEHPHVSVKAVQEMGDMALAIQKEHPAGVLNIVDHVDHMGAAGASSYKASVEAVAAIHDHAKQYGTRWLVTTQVHNRTAGAGGDRFWRHRPIPIAAIKNGQHKEEIATRIFCAYRPLKIGVTPDELKAVIEGRAEIGTCLANGVTAVDCLKHRHFGSRVGERVLLGWENGRITDLPMSDRLAQEGAKHGIKSNRNY